MSHPAAREARRPSGGERIFTDDDGRLWTATRERGTNEAVVFSCSSDPRQSVRALATDDVRELTDVDDETLRDWLRAAPRIGRLT